MIDPWGKIIANSELEETITWANIDLNEIDNVRT